MPSIGPTRSLEPHSYGGEDSPCGPRAEVFPTGLNIDRPSCAIDNA